MKNILEVLREEINLRLERETRYVEILAGVIADKETSVNRLEARKFLENEIEKNEAGLRRINSFIRAYRELPLDEINWEQFCFKEYWQRKGFDADYEMEPEAYGIGQIGKKRDESGNAQAVE